MCTKNAMYLEHLIKCSGMSQSDFAREIGVTKSAVSMYLSGNTNPSEETWKKIAESTSTPLSEIMEVVTISNKYPDTKVKIHLALCKELNRLYEQKNHDYGDSFHQTFVEEGMAMVRIRLSDKLNRFKTLSRGGEQKVNDESIRDTLIDLANYAIMTVLEMEVANDDVK